MENLEISRIKYYVDKRKFEKLTKERSKLYCEYFKNKNKVSFEKRQRLTYLTKKLQRLTCIEVMFR